MRNVLVDDGVAKGDDLAALVDQHAIQSLLDVVDDIGVLDIRYVGIAIEGLEGIDDFFRFVGKIQNEGLVLARIRAIQT